MSLNPDIRDRAYQFFIEEAQELLQVLETGLLDLRQDHSTPKVHELMRAAHSIKGGAASVELGAIELLAHRLEDFIKALYSDGVEFDGELEGLLLQGYDCLSNPLSEQIELGTFDEEAALLAAEPVFAALEVRLENALKNADNYIPSANDLGVDIVDSIFEVDVVQALEHLQKVAANSSNCDPVAELQGQLEMFAGFAELFNLPGFSDIVQTALAALAQNPHRAVEIIQLTVADCTIARDLVLAGDREQGGSVSPALRELAQATAKDTVFNNPEPSIVLDKMALDEDILWSDAPEVELLADDIFGAIPDELTAKEFIDQPEVAAEIRQTIDSEPIAFDEITLDEDILWSETPKTESLADDIFGGLLSDEFSLEEPVAETVDLENIFGTAANAEAAVQDDINQFEVNSDEQAAAETNAQMNSEPEAIGERLNEAEDPYQAENITAAIESLEDRFDSLPSLASEPTSLSLPMPKTAGSLKAEAAKLAKKSETKATPKL